MKKVILTIGVLGLLCSCSTNQNINELNELKNKINTIQQELLDCELYMTKLDSLNKLEIYEYYFGMDDNPRDYEFVGDSDIKTCEVDDNELGMQNDGADEE